MLPLNHKRTTSSLVPPIICVAKKLAIKRWKVPHLKSPILQEKSNRQQFLCIILYKEDWRPKNKKKEMFCVCPRRVGFFAEKKFRENFANFCFLLTSIPAINACKHFSKCWTENKSQFIFVKKVLNAFKLFYFIHFIILDVKLKRNCKAEHFSFVIFGAQIFAKKARVKCWWNWHLLSISSTFYAWIFCTKPAFL